MYYYCKINNRRKRERFLSLTGRTMNTVISRQYIVDRRKPKFFLFVFLLFTIYYLLSATPVLAQQTEYELLAPLPGYVQNTTGNKTTASKYIEGIFTLIIAIAGLLAVIMIIFGGIKYMSTDAFTGKSEAKATIEHAIWGLLLAVSAWLILNTINPNLVNFNISVQPTVTTPPPGGISTGSCTNCVTLQSLGIPTSGSATGGSIETSFGNKLVLLNTVLTGIAWSVTEAYPASVLHVSACHSNGTCVDANVANPSASNINQFASAASVSGLIASYEVQTTAEQQTLINAGVNASIIIVNAGATGPHFHVR